MPETDEEPQQPDGTVETDPDALQGATLLRLAPGIVKVWTIKSGIAAFLLTGSAIVYDLASTLTGSGFLPLGVLSVIVAGATGGLAFGVPKLRYRYWRYLLRTEELFLERGIFNRVRTVVPLRRIQHLDVSQDLIEREFSLGKLIVHTAGTRSSDVVLPGLNIDEANRLRDTVKHYILEDDAV